MTTHTVPAGNQNAVEMSKLLVLSLYLVKMVAGHGRLMEPPARNSMWRFGFPNPVNYNDNELFCGGYAVQWEQNEGKCGICGDAYHIEQPRPHEAGGIYAKGIISRHFSVGQNIDIEIELTANHYGRFEILLCPNNNPKQEATQSCFDRFPLYLNNREISYIIPENGKKKAVFRYQVRLPPYITCTQCVLQWTYYTGNQWGMCPNGTQAQGCGKSETFRNCADVAIHSSTGGAVPPIFVESLNPYQLFYKDHRRPAPYNVVPLVVRDQVCLPHGLYRMIPGMADWCQKNCLKYPPNCPLNICTCPNTCEAVGAYKGNLAADVFCMDKCIVYPNENCPLTDCSCYEE
ncbi:uncharacterized protein LOC130444348 [Diorhabda sublineata]|uniref:uncharacterized protein LOC130444348 n=1 Tax=Diorhabda sublineata TaxID=1163346 RepID=UPI0024E133F2|nr:uncharacterized protein LOC130444348 [Diorhabda sublineata]